MKHIIKTIISKCFLLCVGLLLVITSYSCVFAESINFDDCYMPWEYGDSQKSYIYVRPHGSKCDKICENQCREFSQPSEFSSTDCKKRKGDGCLESSQSGVPNSLTGAQLNQDIIEKCLVHCRKGEGSYFSSDYRVKDDGDSSIFGWKWAKDMGKEPITINTMCSTDGEQNDESIDFAYFPISFDVKENDVVIFSLGNSDTSYGNTIFLGGFETVRISPDYWYTKPEQPNKGGWSVKSSDWKDTGVKLKNGDYLRFAYGGKFFGNYVGKDKGSVLPYTSDKMYIPSRSDLDLTFNGTCFGEKSYFPGEESAICYYTDNQKSYCINKQNQTIDCADKGCVGFHEERIIENNNNDSSNSKCFLGGTRATFVKKKLKVEDSGWSANYIPLDKFEFQGYFKGHISGDTLQIKYKDDYIEKTECSNAGTGEGRCIRHKIGWCSGLSCCAEHAVIYYQKCVQTINGVVVNEGQPYTVSQDVYEKGTTSKSEVKQRSYSNNFGGYEVEISRKGSPHFNGDGLQYAIVEVTGDEYKPWGDGVKWHDAKKYLDGSKDNPVPIDKNGKIYFRIDPALIQGGREATLGSYGVIVNKEDTKNSRISKTISDIINQITRFFIGEDGNKASSGKVQYIFNKLTQDPLIINGIRALLVLYLIYTGISYMIGFAKITQQEVINRVLKIAFVAMIISPDSWVFFNKYLFNMLLNASMELIYDIIQPIANIEKISVGNPTHAELVNTVFGMFDGIFHQLFNNTIWTKIWALICTSLVGTLIALLIIIAIVSYLICALRIIITYLYSMITLCILFILAPIFISFMLFNKTSKLFKSWINNMISMVFQPIFAFVALAILHELFVMTLHAALSFTACPTCLLSFNIFGSYLCLPWKNAWWVALYGAHFPLQASMSSPINLLTPVLALLIVVQAMDGMVRLASSFANKIATSSFYGFDLEAVAIKTQSYATSAVSKVGKTALGMGNYDIKDRGDKKDDGNKKDNGDKKGDSKNKPDQVKRK